MTKLSDDRKACEAGDGRASRHSGGAAPAHTLQPVSFRKGRARLPRLSAPYVPGRRHERFWTEAQRDVLRRYYPTGGAADGNNVRIGKKRAGRPAQDDRK